MLAQFIYHHPRYFALLIICVLAVGINSFANIPRQEEPSLTNFVGTITTFYPGATPDRVEALVTKPLEDELRKLSELDELSSTSSTGVSFLNIRLDDTLPKADLERVWSEIRDAMADAATRFPPGAGDPSFDNDRLNSFTTIVALSGRDGADIPLSILGRLAQELADEARNLNNTKLGEGMDMLIELSGDFDSLTRIREVIVSTAANGSATRISDIATVYKAATTPPPSMVLVQGKPGILVGVLMEDGNQVDRWSADFGRMLETFTADAPASVLIEQTFDQSEYAQSRLIDVSNNLGIGVFLVLLVLLFTLGWRAAVGVAIILPLCGLISLVIMERTGMALHQMSIAGLIVALGLLVDGSIVMTDEIRKRLLEGQGPYEAIAVSVQRLRIPLLSSAVTTILAFMPMAILPGVAGDFIGAVAISVIVRLLTSTLLALVLTPVLAARSQPALVRWRH